MRILVGSVLVGLVACGSPEPAPRKPDPNAGNVRMTSDEVPLAPQMGPFTYGGYELTGAEYWPYVGEADIKYPEEVLWGFYPEKGKVPPGESEPNPASVSQPALQCAWNAWNQLHTFLYAQDKRLARIVEIGVKNGTMVPRFYLWTNDYSQAADPYPPGMREARLWWWARKTPEPPKPPGYWKWESVVDQKGGCHMPKQEQIDAYLDEKLAEMEKTQAASR